MKRRLFLGVDIGTFEAKGVVIDVDGHCVASAKRPHQLIVATPGWAEHDANETWWSGFVKVTQMLLQQVDPREIVAVGCSGIGPCVLPLDSEMRPMRNAILYGIDTRATEEADFLTSKFGESEILESTGIPLGSQAAGPKILWLKNHEPDVYSKASLFTTCQSYLVGCLTDRWVIDHSTAGYFSPCYDLGTNTWNHRRCEPIVEVARLPKLLWSTDVAGTITAKASTETGLPGGLPVIVGTADAPAEAIAAGVLSPGQLMLMYGSSMFMIQPCEGKVRAENFWCAPNVFPGSSLIAGGTSTAGTLTRWFVDIVASELNERQIRNVDDTDHEFGRLAKEAASSAISPGGLIALPHFSGERTPLNDPTARGAVVGLNLTHNRADIFRALLDGIATGIRWNFEAMAAIGAAPELVRSVGGGTLNQVWLQAISDSTGVAQQVLKSAGAAFGSALLAAVGEGSLSKPALCSRIPDVTVVEPNTAARLDYDRLSERSRRLYEALRTIRD